MSWHYQATKVTEYGEDLYTVREVYEKYGWTIDPVYAIGNTKEELIQCLKDMLRDVEEFPVLDIEKEDVE